MCQRNARGTRSFCHGTGAELMHSAKALGAALIGNADKIDDVVGTCNGAVDGPTITQISLNRLYLADAAQRLEVEGKVRTANGDTNAITALGQRPHDVTTDKT
jgi:hypothetical protein